MRLTLRTMLAYMHGILEPKDAEEIAQKIEENESASKLLHHTRDVMRRLRIGAPPMEDQGGNGLDPNTVAEYLDHILPADRVPDFERVCLDSDVHMAEVAACHQILTLVLGEPAEVDPDSRERMYQIPEVAAAQEAVAAKPFDDAPAHLVQTKEDGEAAHVAQPRPKQQVPEYLKADLPGRNPIWSVAMAAMFLVLAGYILMVVTGNGGVMSQMLGFKPKGQIDEPYGKGEPILPPEADSVSPLASKAAGEDRPSLPGDESDVWGKPGQAEQPPTDTGTPPEIPEELTELPDPGELSDDLDQADGGSAEVPEEALVEADPADPDGSDETQMASRPTEPAIDRLEGELAAETQEQESAPQPLGELSTTNEVLLAFDPEETSWKRVVKDSTILSGVTYSSLPAFRPSIKVGESLEVRLVGPTRVQFMAADADGVPGLYVEYGRLVIAAHEDGSRIRLKVGERTGLVGFGDATSTVAVEVGRSMEVGHDPETQPGLLSAGLYATTGKIFWQEGPGSSVVTFKAPVRLTINDQPIEAAAVDQFPQWISADIVGPLDQRGAVTVEQGLPPDRVFLSLRELAEHRKREVHWLALRCLAAIGDFELTVRELDNPDRRVMWPEYVTLLVDAVGQSPEVAAEVRAAMEKLHGAEGTRLYEMLWRFDKKLEESEADELVGYLDHDTLAFRFVAFWNLKRITGMGLTYEPDATAAQRRVPIQRWKERIATMIDRKQQPPARVPGQPVQPLEEDSPEMPAAPNPPEINPATPASEDPNS